MRIEADAAKNYLIVFALDNPVKGAAGQAVQNVNLASRSAKELPGSNP